MICAMFLHGGLNPRLCLSKSFAVTYPLRQTAQDNLTTPSPAPDRTFLIKTRTKTPEAYLREN